MCDFPLYNSLSIEVENKRLSTQQKRSFIKNVEKMDQEGLELIYALIKKHQLSSSDGYISHTLPYNGMNKDNEILFDINDLPFELQQILFKFIRKHIDKMKADKKLKK